MTQAETQSIHPEVMRGVPFNPWTFAELVNAFEAVQGKLISDREEIDPIDYLGAEDVEVIGRSFQLDGRVVDVKLIYNGVLSLMEEKDGVHAWPDTTGFGIEFPLPSMKPVVTKFPVEFYMGFAEEDEKEGKFEYELKLRGIDPIKGFYEQDKQGYCYNEGVYVNGELKRPYFQGGGHLRTMEITIK